MRQLGVCYIRLAHDSVDRGLQGYYLSWQESTNATNFTEALRVANAPHDSRAFPTPRAIRQQYRALGFAEPRMTITTWAPVFVTHPRLGELFFSSVLNRHGSWLDGHHVFGNLSAPVRPYHCLWGNGTDISNEELECLREFHAACRTDLRLTVGDLIVVDNLRMQHGRAPFTPGTKPRLLGLAMGPMMNREANRDAPPPSFAQF